MPRSKIFSPEKPRSNRFPLTPLADAMFQILIFFMLTSSLTPFSLLTLQTAAIEENTVGTDDEAAPTAPPSPQEATAPPAVVIWNVEAGAVQVAGSAQPYDIGNSDDLDALASSLGGGGTSANVLLLIRDTALVQDVATVMAALSRADVSAVQVARAKKDAAAPTSLGKAAGDPISQPVSLPTTQGQD